jgi:5'-3' exonuclease
MNSETIILDCNYLGHRARYSLRGLSHGAKGTGVIFGFLSQLQTFYEMFKTNDFVFCWDSKVNIRKMEYPWYKARPPKTQEEQDDLKDAIRQFNILRQEILPDFGFRNVICKRGYESDDLFALITRQWMGEFVVVTADEDIYQILNHCRIYNPNKNIMMTASRFKTEYGIPCSKWVDVKAIGGCTSDKVPGVPGVGEGTALKYLKGELKPGSKKLKDIESTEGQARIKENYGVVRLPIEDFEVDPKQRNHLDINAFMEVCIKYGMKSLMEEDSLEIWDAMFRGANTANEKIKRGLGLIGRDKHD